VIPEPAQAGSCARIVDEERELLCGKAADAEVLVRSPFSLFAVLLCPECLTQHRAFYNERRKHRHPARKHSANSNQRG
jgi:hypothetical protein